MNNNILRILAVLLLGLVIGVAVYYEFVKSQDEIIVALGQLILTFLALAGLVLNVWQIRKSDDIQKQLKFYRAGFMAFTAVAFIVWLFFAYILLPPLKYWTARPTNFFECLDAAHYRTGGTYYEPPQCRFRGTIFFYTWADWADQLKIQTPTLPSKGYTY